MEMVQSILTSCAAAATAQNNRTDITTTKQPTMRTTVVVGKSGSCEKCTFLRKIGARYLSKEMLSFRTTTNGSPPINGNCNDDTKRCDNDQDTRILFMSTQGSQSPKITSLNGIPLRHYTNSAVAIVGKTAKDAGGGSMMKRTNSSPVTTTKESIRLSHGDEISVVIPAYPNPRTASSGDTNNELQKMHFSVIRKIRRRRCDGKFLPSPPSTSVDASRIGVRDPDVIRSTPPTRNLESRIQCRGGSPTSDIISVVVANNRDSKEEIGCDKYIDRKQVVNDENRLIQEESKSNPVTKQTKSIISTTNLDIDCSGCNSGILNLTKSQPDNNSREYTLHERINTPNSNIKHQLNGKGEEDAMSDEESPMLSMEHFSENNFGSASLQQQQQQQAPTLFAPDGFSSNYSVHHSVCDVVNGCDDILSSSHLKPLCNDRSSRKGNSFSPSSSSNSNTNSNSNSMRLSNFTLTQIRKMTNTDAKNSAKDPSSRNTVASEKSKLQDSLLRLILHQNDNANNNNCVVLGDGDAVEGSLLLPALLQNTCISSSLHSRAESA